MADARTKKQAKTQWQKLLKDALEFDSWGQSLEAVEEYEKLTRLIETQIPDLRLTPEERNTCLKIRQALLERTHTLQDVTASGIKHEEIKKLMQVLDVLFDKAVDNFPVALQTTTMPSSIDRKEEIASLGDENREVKSEGGTLLPAPSKIKHGQTTFSVFIDKIGLKDAQTYIAAHLTISVADGKSTVLETQDTPHSNKLKPQYVTFGTNVFIQTPFDDFKQGHAVFFEFKHFKPKKKKQSTRCFAFMEFDEIQKAKDSGGALVLEIYKKPTDLARNKLNLFSIKKLYLHVQLNFVKH